MKTLIAITLSLALTGAQVQGQESKTNPPPQIGLPCIVGGVALLIVAGAACVAVYALFTKGQYKEGEQIRAVLTRTCDNYHSWQNVVTNTLVYHEDPNGTPLIQVLFNDYMTNPACSYRLKCERAQ